VFRRSRRSSSASPGTFRWLFTMIDPLSPGSIFPAELGPSPVCGMMMRRAEARRSCLPLGRRASGGSERQGVRQECDWKHRSLVLHPNPNVADAHRLVREPSKRASMSPRSGRQSASPRRQPWEKFAAGGTSPRSGRQKSGSVFCRPLRGLVLPSFATHSLRCGLPNCRPLRGLKRRRFH